MSDRHFPDNSHLPIFEEFQFYLAVSIVSKYIEWRLSNRMNWPVPKLRSCRFLIRCGAVANGGINRKRVMWRRNWLHRGSRRGAAKIMVVTAPGWLPAKTAGKISVETPRNFHSTPFRPLYLPSPALLLRKPL